MVTQYLSQGGIWNYFILIVFVVLLMSGLILLLVSKNKRLFLIYSVLAFVPLLIGFYGDFIPDLPMAWRPMHVGVVSSLPLLLIGLFGIARKN